MGNVRKTKAGSAEKIFDRLTVLVMNHELLLSGTYGPLTAEQKAVLNDLVQGSKEVATLVRELTDL
jgi:hypothetical protein